MNPPVISLENVSIRYGGREAVAVVDAATLAIEPGRTHGLVGESGSGKSTIARAIVGLAPIVSGIMCLYGTAVDPQSRSGAAKVRPRVQMVFQNPYASLNPRMTVGEVLEEALTLHQPTLSDRAGEAAAILDQVGLDRSAAVRYPHQFSGGQRQRVAIARALATAAPLLILDEVTSALDVSVQATVLNLLRDLQRSRGLSYLFISHDLAAVRYVSDVVSVMYLGRIVETASRDALFGSPRHPYTKGLLAAVPTRDAYRAPSTARVSGEIGDPKNPPQGCRFHPRCPTAAADPQLRSRCAREAPHFIGDTPRVACHAAAHVAPTTH